MKITNVETTVMVAPFEIPARWSFGTRTGTTSTIVKLTTDEEVSPISERHMEE